MAAGNSSRLGLPKQLLEFEGETLLRRISREALAIPDARVSVVIGAYPDPINSALKDSNVAVVINPHWATGMSTSIVVGLGDLLKHHPNLDRCIISLCDQPFVDRHVFQQLIQLADGDADGGYRQIGLGDYLTQLDARRSPMDSRPQVAVVVAEGEISGGDLPAGRIGGVSTSALLREARDDDDVKAVVLRVDSPGGEVFASEQIRREVEALKAAGKPVVVSMGDMAASGGYWISMNADRIYADESTITGSIGIFGMIPNFARSLDKIGVHTDGVGTTRFAGAFDVTRPMDPAVGQVIQSVINKGYADFTGKVAAARNKPVEAVDEVARGRVWSGAQAKERGLVDAFGGLKAAVAFAAERAKLGESDKFRVRYIEKAATPFAQFMTGFAGSRAGAWMLADSGIARMLIAKQMPELDTQLRFVEDAVKDRNGAPVKSLAYCFCGL